MLFKYSIVDETVFPRGIIIDFFKVFNSSKKFFSIKSQSIFKKGSGILITLFVSNISWLTFIAACYYGFKNFSFHQASLGIVFSIILIHLAFARLSLYINSKFNDKNKLLRIKTVIEYSLRVTILNILFMNLY